jgi:arginase
MHIHILTAPYDSGNYNTRMGGGPLRLVQLGLETILQAAGHQVVIEEIKPARPFRAEIATAFDLQHQVAGRIQALGPDTTFPLVLSGNCNTAIGTISGIGADTLGVIWFDAHVDFNTPETTAGGFLDGMGVAIATGRCWATLAAQVPGFVPIADERVLYVGSRDIGSSEQTNLDRSRITLIKAAQIHEAGISAALAPALRQLQTYTQSVYVHLDLDVLDPSLAPANEYAAANGLTLEDMLAAIQLIREHFAVVAAGVASYDPKFDLQNRLAQAAFQLIQAVIAK